MPFFSFPRRLPPVQQEKEQPEWVGDAKVVTWMITVMCDTCKIEWPEIIDINHLNDYEPQHNDKKELVYISPLGECSDCLAKRAQKEERTPK